MGSLDVTTDCRKPIEILNSLEKSTPTIILVKTVSSATENSSFSLENINDNPQQFQIKRYPQWLAVISAQIGGFALGAIWFWTCTGLPDLERTGELGQVTDADKSWTNSIVQLGALVVCPLTGFCASRFGRRSTMLWSNIPFTGACILIGTARSMWILYAGRFVVGVCGGIYSQLIPIFVSEVCQPEIRGMLICMFEILTCIGVLFIYIIGTYFSWRMQIYICAAIPIVGFICLWFIPESPYFLMERNLTKEAGEALRWLRGASSVEQVSQELGEISTCVWRKSESSSQSASWHVLLDPSVLKPILLSMGIMTFFQISFINVFRAASFEIFQSAGVDDEYLCTIIIGITQLVATLVPIFVSDKLGRKKLFMISLSLLTLSMLTLGTFFHFNDSNDEHESFTNSTSTDDDDSYTTKEEVSQWGWVPLTSLMMYIIATSLGISPLSWVVVGEITPPKAKGLAITIITIWNRTVAFIVLFVYWDMLSFFGKDGTYWTIAAFAVIGANFINTCIPETKGKTLDEIQLYFSREASKSIKL